MEEKFRLLMQLGVEDSAKKKATQIEVGKSTVSDWKNARADIENRHLTYTSTSCIKKYEIMKKTFNNKANEALYL